MNTMSDNSTDHAEGGSVLTGVNPLRFNSGNPLPLFIIQTTLIISLCYLVHLVLARFRQPRVISEVVAGILLGPSIMGHIPHFHDTIFPAPSLPFLNLVSNIGLVLFLFLVGLELDPKLVLQRARRALGISIAGIALPFGLGAAVSLLLYRELEGPEAAGPSIGVFILFCGVAMSITAFAVLARILADMKLLGTTVGFLVVCAGALGDIVAWILLALVVSIINSASPITPLYVVLLAIGWCLILVFAVRPLLLYLVRITHSEEEPSQAMIAITVLVVLVSAFVTDIIGIHAIFGGFLVGLLIPHDSGFAEGMTRRLEDLIGVIFLPIYFALSGLKTRIGLLDNAEAWGLVVLVTMVACAGKIAGCSAAAMLNGMTWRESLAIGFLMNCKGLVELIVLNIGYDAGVINDKVFVIMVAMCLLTTMMATPFVRLVFPVSYQKELEAKRARELQEMEYDGMGDGDLPTSDEKKATHLYPDIRQRKGGVGSTASTITYARSEKNSLRRHVIAQVDHGGLLSDMTVRDVSHVPRREGIMLCLDKTANAPSVMALLQLFASSAAQNAMSHSTSFQQDMSQHQRTRSNQYIPDPHAASFLQPPVPSFDSDSEYVDSHSTHHRRAHGLRSDPQPTPPVFALRILSISERTTSVMLTASRCLDRLYKDTVMMMVMAFSKLNSIPVQPLVTLSTNVASPDVVDDILDRADEHGAACIIFPWNSSHLADLGSSDRPPGATWSHSATTVPLSVQPTNTSAAPTEQQRSHHAVPFRHRVYTNTSETSVPEYGLHRGPRHLHEFFHWPQRFDHDEAHRVTAGRHTDLSESGRHHRTSVTSNTKVLSKLLQLCPQHQIATGALVDRGLGLFGGVRHIVVPLFGGRDDEEALTMAGSLATNRGAKCFVTVVRVAEQLLPPLSPLNRPTSTIESSSLRPRHWKSPSASIDPHIPVVRSATPDLSVRGFDDGSSEAVPSKLGARVFSGESLVSVDMRIPKNDEELLCTFFPTKPRFKGGSRYMNRTRSIHEAHSDDDAMDPPDAEDDGAMVLRFQTMADVVAWAKHTLTVHDLMIVGADVPAHLQQLWSSGRMDIGSHYAGALGKSESFGSSLAEEGWTPDDGASFRFNVDAPTPLQKSPLGSSVTIDEQPGSTAAAATFHLVRPTLTVRDDSSSPSRIPLPTGEASVVIIEDPPAPPSRTSLTLSPPRISVTTHDHDHHHPSSSSSSRNGSSPCSPAHSRTSFSSFSNPRASMHSQRSAAQAQAQARPVQSTRSTAWPLHSRHASQTSQSSFAIPTAQRQSLSGKRTSIYGGGKSTAASAAAAAAAAAVATTRPPLPVDTERQLILGHAAEYFIQSHVQVSFLVMRSRSEAGRSDPAAAAAAALQSTGSQRASVGFSLAPSPSSMVPLGTRTGTGVSTGAGVGSDGGGGASGGRSGRGGGGGGGGGGASRFALPRSAMEVASPTLSDEEGVPRCAPGEQRQHPGGVLSQMTQQSTLYDEEQSVTSPVNDSQVSLCNNTSKIV